MSKIKTNNLQARADDGTLNIGKHYTDKDPNSPTFGQELDDYNHLTRIWGSVNIPNYASKQWVIDEVINGLEGGVDFREFVKRDEADVPDGYPKLDADSNVKWPQMSKTINDSHMLVNATGNGLRSHTKIDLELDQLREDLDDLAEKTQQAVTYEIGPTGSSTPAKGTFSANATDYSAITSIVAHKEDKEESEHDFSHVKIGDNMEITGDDDHYGLYTVDAINIADPYCTFAVSVVSSKGDAIVGDTVYINVLPSVDTREFLKIDGTKRMKGDNATIRWDAASQPEMAINAEGQRIRATKFDVPTGGGVYMNNSYRISFGDDYTSLGYGGTNNMQVDSAGVRINGENFRVYGTRSGDGYSTTEGNKGDLISVMQNPLGAAGSAQYWGSISHDKDIATKQYVDDSAVDTTSFMPKSGGTFTGEVTHTKDIIIRPPHGNDRFVTMKMAAPQDEQGQNDYGSAFGLKIDLSAGTTGNNRFRITGSNGSDMLFCQGNYNSIKYYGDKSSSQSLATQGDVKAVSKGYTLYSSHASPMVFVTPPKSLTEAEFSMSTNYSSASWLYLFKLKNKDNYSVKVLDYKPGPDSQYEIFESSTGNIIQKGVIPSISGSDQSSSDAKVYLRQTWAKPGYSFSTTKTYGIVLTNMVPK